MTSADTVSLSDSPELIAALSAALRSFTEKEMVCLSLHTMCACESRLRPGVLLSF